MNTTIMLEVRCARCTSPCTTVERCTSYLPERVAELCTTGYLCLSCTLIFRFVERTIQKVGIEWTRKHLGELLAQYENIKPAPLRQPTLFGSTRELNA